MEVEGNLDDFIKKVFSNDPMPRNSYQIQYNNPNVDNANEFIFKELVYTLTEGLKILYGNTIDLSNITEQNIQKIKEYFNSFGFNIYLKVENILDEKKRKNNKRAKEIQKIKMKKKEKSPQEKDKLKLINRKKNLDKIKLNQNTKKKKYERALKGFNDFYQKYKDKYDITIDELE